MDSNVIYISSFASMALHTGRYRSLAIPCFTKGEVCHRAASELANTDSASELTCRHMMTSQFRSEREKTRKREISRDFSRFFDPEFFRSFIDPFSMLCPDSDSRKGLFCVFPKAIDSVAGLGLAKAQNLFVISLLRAFLAQRCSFHS